MNKGLKLGRKSAKINIFGNCFFITKKNYDALISRSNVYN